ncbi:MAG TPA: hypothetical protein VFK89_05905 [Actinomycetota bacterium]|nr:hypothetical protein [Actinomycetota bacterium]
MTALIGASVLLICAAAIALVFGWIAASPPLIWLSIGSSVVAAVLLALGAYRARSEIAAQAASGVAAGPGEVVAIPDRKRYHKPGCRYASAPGAEVMSVEAAKRRGYDACGVCKP